MEPGIHGIAGLELSAFIGREPELRELRSLAPQARALTLCGAGGIGKTRLAVRLIAALAAGFPDGAWFVELADLRQPDLVVSRIATALGVSEEPGRPLIDTLADAIRPRTILLALDTCEHLVGACAQLCHQLLAAAPGLRVIATSREPLRVAAETVWQVPPLSLPPDQPAAADPAASDALRLFADRAAVASPGFVLGPASLAPVAAVCRALDGLPLAIELAAAWVRALSPDQIASRLADRLLLLSSPERTAPARHRTLRAAIDWSHDLLAAREKVLLRRLSVFAGWPLDMAEKVCADPALPDGQVLDVLTALADKSLVVAEPDVGGQIRYRMLDTVREYAAGRLAESGESPAVHARLRDYVVREVEQLHQVGMAQVAAPWSARVEVFRRFDMEAPNLRQVLGKCLADGDAEAGLRICASARPVWIVQGSFAEGAGWLDSFLALYDSGLSDDVRGRGLVSRAQLALATDPAAARRYALAGLGLCRGEGSRFWAASALNLLAEAAVQAGQMDEATARADEALAVARSASDKWNEGYAIGTLAVIAGYGGDLAGARRLGEAALEITREIDQQWGSARNLLGLGDLARLSGDPERARQLYAEALPILREIGGRPQIARCLAGLGRLAQSQGDLAAAGRHLSESLELSRSAGSRIGVIRALDAFASLAVAQNDPGIAVRLAAAAAGLRRAAELPEARAGRTQRIVDAAASLGEQAIGEEWAEGYRLTSDAAAALALSLVQPSPGHPGRRRDPSRDDEGRRDGPQADASPGGLTPRELEVVALIARGHTNKAIADELSISQPTAARHVANIMAKLSFTSRVQVAAWALDQTRDQARDAPQGPRPTARTAR
jgi:predicted ATPase/DNA-binding CsgD family transcriptional regulator